MENQKINTVDEYFATTQLFLTSNTSLIYQRIEAFNPIKKRAQ